MHAEIDIKLSDPNMTTLRRPDLWRTAAALCSLAQSSAQGQRWKHLLHRSRNLLSSLKEVCALIPVSYAFLSEEGLSRSLQLEGRAAVE
jgi:hypothetical protein